MEVVKPNFFYKFSVQKLHAWRLEIVLVAAVNNKNQAEYFF